MGSRTRGAGGYAQGLANDWGIFARERDLPNAPKAALQTNELELYDRAQVGGAHYMCTDPTQLAAVWAQLPANAEMARLDAAEAALTLMAPAYGEVYLTAALATTPASSGTPLKALGTTTLSQAVAFDDDGGVSNRLRYIGPTTKVMHIASSVSMTAGSNSVVVGVSIAKNGVVIPGSNTRRKIGTGSDVGSTALHAATAMATNDYLEIWVENETNTATVTLVTANLFAMGMVIPS